MTRHPPTSPLFPSPTLFRSRWSGSRASRSRVYRVPSDPIRQTDGVSRSEEHTSELQSRLHLLFLLFFLNDPPPPDISPLSLPDALPISVVWVTSEPKPSLPSALGPNSSDGRRL